MLLHKLQDYFNEHRKRCLAFATILFFLMIAVGFLLVLLWHSVWNENFLDSPVCGVYAIVLLPVADLFLATLFGTLFRGMLKKDPSILLELVSALLVITAIVMLVYELPWWILILGAVIMDIFYFSVLGPDDSTGKKIALFLIKYSILFVIFLLMCLWIMGMGSLADHLAK